MHEFGAFPLLVHLGGIYISAYPYLLLCVFSFTLMPTDGYGEFFSPYLVVMDGAALASTDKHDLCSFFQGGMFNTG